jgi:EAL domain-containing protein (putative c-di-GMP-specific phosphodiesterase class I)
LNVSINISAIQLLRHDFIDNLIKMINDMKIQFYNVGLEITESIFASNYAEINSIIEKVKNSGIHISIDDFGIEYSSLARAHRLKVDCLKIDKTFIDKLAGMEVEDAIANDIISMAHKLGHCVIAEGIEHERQKQYLLKYGCDRIQGDLISKPLYEEEAIELLKRYNH